MYKAERNTYKFTVYKFANLTISTFQSMYKAENKDIYFAVLSLKEIIITWMWKLSDILKRFNFKSMNFE